MEKKTLLQLKRKAIYKDMECAGFEPVYNFGGEFQGIGFDYEFYGGSNDVFEQLDGQTDTMLYQLYEFLMSIENIEEQIYS